MTTKSYLADDSLSGSATVTEILEGDRSVVRLSQTWFHPQGGGQKADRGTIGPANVLHVANNVGRVDHYVDSVVGLKVGVRYPIHVDGNWRRLNSAYHTAGHLIACITEALFPQLKAVSGHQWPAEGRVEFDGYLDDADMLCSSLKVALADATLSALPVTITGDPFVDRSIRIGEFPSIPCGGTHVASIADIGVITVESVTRKNERTRVSYSVSLAP